MIIRCPHCEHTRSISEGKIPPTAELASCPKCKHRFRFRTLPRNPGADGDEAAPEAKEQRQRTSHGPDTHRAPDSAPAPPAIATPEVLRPQAAFRESEGQNDIWDAVDALHQRWEKQIDQHVVDVEQPRPLTAPTEETPTQQAAAVQETQNIPEAAVAPAVAAAPENDKPRVRFPYGADGPDPEERVEKDMEMLRLGTEARPTRDLGRLREFSDQPGETDEEGLLHLPPVDEAGQDDESWGIPWERADMGKITAFNATVRGVMLGGPAFFARFVGGGSLAPGYLFFLLMGYICILCSLAWGKLAETLLPGLLPPLPAGAALPALLLLAPAALGLMQLFVTGWIRLFLRLFAPDRAHFGLVYKIVSYSVAPFVLSAVPFAGPLLGAAWFMASLASGCRGALGLSLPLSLFLPLPPAFLLLAGLAWFFL